MFFAKYEKVDGVYYNAYNSASRKGNIVEYDEEKHFKKLAPETGEVDGFEIDEAKAPEVDNTTLDDITISDMPFDLDPGFDL